MFDLRTPPLPVRAMKVYLKVMDAGGKILASSLSDIDGTNGIYIEAAFKDFGNLQIGVHPLAPPAPDEKDAKVLKLVPPDGGKS